MTHRASLQNQWKSAPGLLVICLVSVVLSAASLGGNIIGMGQLSQALVETANSAVWFWLFVTIGCFLASLLLISGLEITSNQLAARVLVDNSVSVAGATLGPPVLDPLEDESFVTRVSTIDEEMRDVAGLEGIQSFWMLLSIRLSAVVGFVIVANWSIPVALILAVAFWLNSRTFGRYLLSTRLELSSPDFALRRRQADYFRQLNLMQSSAKEIRLFGLSRWNVERFTFGWQLVMEDVWAKRNRQAVVTVLSGLVLPLVIAGSFWLLVNEAMLGSISVGVVVTIISALGWFEGFGAQGDTQSLATRFSVTAQKIADLQQELISEGTQSQKSISAGSLPANLAVEINGLRFQYPGAMHPVFEDFGLEIKRGEHLAIVGENGAGKSTLIRLLCGLYRPVEGEVFTSGRILTAFQDFVHWPVTVQENVLFGDDSERLFANALSRVAATELVDSLPHHGQTVLSSSYSEGSDLSGGQWQRIAIARALANLGDQDILVLDEPTAALDVRAETEIFNQLIEATKGQTMILVSHRLNSVRRADRIVVIDGGKIIEDGSHDELMAVGGTYAEMFRIQSRRYLEDSDEQSS